MLTESPACSACTGVIIAAVECLVQTVRSSVVVLCCTLHIFSALPRQAAASKSSVGKLEVERLLGLLGSREDVSGCKVAIKSPRIVTPLCT